MLDVGENRQAASKKSEVSATKICCEHVYEDAKETERTNKYFRGFFVSVQDMLLFTV